MIRSIFTPPDDPQRSRLARRYSNEISIYLGENNTVYVNHVSVTGPKDPSIPINMLWQAMQLMAMRSGVTLRLPSEAAGPAEIGLPPGTVPIPADVSHRPQTAIASMQEANGSH